jgi:hypothetical protein
MKQLPTIQEKKRLKSPTVTPQALASTGEELWISSRDLGTLCKIDINDWKVRDEIKPPGIVWAAVRTNGALYLTIGEGRNDDRFVYHFNGGSEFLKLFACPEFTGSYLSFDGNDLYLSQWYEQRILKLDAKGEIARKIDIGAEICGHTFVDGSLYVLRGTENVPRPAYASGPPLADKFRNGAKQGDEQWWIAQLNPRDEKPDVVDIAKVPFAARSLTFDGNNFWSNHRAANETVCFSFPNV